MADGKGNAGEPSEFCAQKCKKLEKQIKSDEEYYESEIKILEDDAEASARRYGADLAEAEEAKEKAEEAKAEAEKARAEAEKAAAKAGKAVAKAEEAKATAEEARAEAEKAKAEAEKAADESSNGSVRMRQELEAAKRSHQEAIDERQREMAIVRQEATNRIAKLGDLIRQYQANEQARAANPISAECQQKCATLQAEKDKLQADCEGVVKELRDELQQVKSNLETTLQNGRNVEASLNERTTQLETRNTQYSAVYGQFQTLQATIAKIKSALSQKNTELGAAKQSADRYKLVAESMDERRKALVKECEGLKTQLAKQQTELTDAQELQTNLDTTKAAQEVEETKSQKLATENESLKNERTASQQAAAAVTPAADDTADKLRACEARNAKLEKSHNTMRESAQEAAKRERELQATLDQARKDLEQQNAATPIPDDCPDKLRASEERRVKLEKSQAKMRESLKEATKQGEELQEVLDQAKKDLAQRDEDLKICGEEVAKHKKEAGDAAKLIKEQEAKLEEQEVPAKIPSADAGTQATATDPGVTTAEGGTQTHSDTPIDAETQTDSGIEADAEIETDGEIERLRKQLEGCEEHGRELQSKIDLLNKTFDDANKDQETIRSASAEELRVCQERGKRLEAEKTTLMNNLATSMATRGRLERALEVFSRFSVNYGPFPLATHRDPAHADCRSDARHLQNRVTQLEGQLSEMVAEREAMTENVVNNTVRHENWNLRTALDIANRTLAHRESVLDRIGNVFPPGNIPLEDEEYDELAARLERIHKWMETMMPLQDFTALRTRLEHSERDLAALRSSSGGRERDTANDTPDGVDKADESKATTPPPIATSETQTVDAETQTQTPNAEEVSGHAGGSIVSVGRERSLVRSTQRDLEKAQSRVKRLEAQVEGLESRLDSDEAQSEIRSLKAELVRANEKLEAQGKLFSQRRSKYESYIKSSDAREKNSDRELERLTAETRRIEAHNERLVRMNEQLRASQPSDFSAQNTSLQLQNQELIQQLVKAEKSAKSADSNTSPLKCRKECNRLQFEVDTMTQGLRDARERNSTLVEANAQIPALQEALEARGRQLEAARRELALLYEVIDEGSRARGASGSSGNIVPGRPDGSPPDDDDDGNNDGTGTPSPTPSPKRRSIFSRIFGSSDGCRRCETMIRSVGRPLNQMALIEKTEYDDIKARIRMAERHGLGGTLRMRIIEA
ncbi:hypothetical protein MMC13_001076 [Lambiella insularis]|nr:hypothetical protein [Lambiella insularis]